jgi:hypothetical protein
VPKRASFVKSTDEAKKKKCSALHASNFMEDILSTYYKCTLSAINLKLNVSGYTLIWTFFSRFGM